MVYSSRERGGIRNIYTKIAVNQKHSVSNTVFFCAGAVGIEPTVLVLETSGLPLTDAPITVHIVPYLQKQIKGAIMLTYLIINL